MTAIRTVLALAALVVLGAACSSKSVEGSCERIAEACHPKDKGSGEPHECHEFSESSTDEQCVDREDDCLAACGG